MNNHSQDHVEPDASFHDIGKIVDWGAIGLRENRPGGKPESDPHEFEKCIDEMDWNSPSWGIDPSAAPWRSILTWHKLWPERWPNSLHRWHTKVADWLAAGYSRPLREHERRELSAQPDYKLHKLWTGRKQPDRRLRTSDALRELIEFLNTSPTWPDAVDRYGEQLRCRPEDARPGFDVTSLLAHCVISGKLARLLARCEWRGIDPAGRPTQKAVCRLAQPPLLIISHFRLGFRQRIFRARDLGVFAYMERKLGELAELFADNLISHFGLECVAAFESADTRKRFIQELEDAGFVIDEQTVEKALADYLALSPVDDEKPATHGLMSVLDAPWKAVWAKELPERIDLPICEGCQMAHASKHWPKDHLAEMEGWSQATLRVLSSTPWRDIIPAEIPEQDRGKLAPWLDEHGEEDLCEQCFTIRRQTPPIELLRDWDGDLLYLRIALDLARLAGHEREQARGKTDSALEHLHKAYLRSKHGNIDQALLQQLFISFPMVVDFVQDYKEFLDQIRKKLQRYFGDRAARLAEELWCVGLERRSELFEVLGLVGGCFSEAFPKLLELPPKVENPVGIALSVSKKKHPFFDHWRFLSAPPSDVSVQVVGCGTAAFRLCKYQDVTRALKQAQRRQLCRLAAAARISESLGVLVLRERDKRGVILRELRELTPHVLNFQSARVLANLMEE